jgi:Holliday junction resolvase RusA-like endonuclease
MFKDPKIRAQEQAIQVIASTALPVPFTGPSVRPWAVEIILYVDSARRFDIDNTAKILLDSLNGGVWKDDSQVVRLTITKILRASSTRTEVKLEEL